jgi:prepilin-type N-terminal cleavage/methylation domain-containing protein
MTPPARTIAARLGRAVENARPTTDTKTCTPPVMKRFHALNQEAGFTLIEIMVAIFILLLGVLATTTLLNTANATTDRNQSRNSATNLVRDIVEAARALPYQDAAPTVNSSGAADSTFQTALQNMAPLSGASSLSDALTATPGWQVIRRGVTFTVTLRACVVDDGKDKVALSHSPAAADGSGYYCPSLPASPNTDNDPDDYRRVRATASWAHEGQTFSVTQTSVIINPTGGLGPAPVGGFSPPTQTCPAARPFTATFKDTAVGAVFTINDPAGTQVTVNSPSSTDSVNKTVTFTFNYAPSGTVPDNTYTVEAQAFNSTGQFGRQIVGTLPVNCSQPADPTGLTGGFNWRRCTAYPATCNSGQRIFDLEWNPNAEPDVVGYAVWRVNGIADWQSGSDSGADTRLTCVGRASPTDHPGPADFFESIRPGCWDLTVPGQPSLPGSIGGLVTLNGTNAKYWIQAIDPDPADPSGATLRSASSASPLANHSQVFSVTENMLNVRPTPPLLTVTNVGGSPCLSWTDSIDLDALGTNLGAGAIRFYRIYRDANPVGLIDLGGGVQINDVPYADRIARSSPNQSNSCDTTNPSRSWFLDTSAGTSSWHYWVTAVDKDYLESYPSNDGVWTAP